jgi:hypothetical protein
LAVFGSQYVRDTAQRSDLLVRYSFLAAVVDRFHRSNAEDAERIRAVMSSDDVILTSLMTGRNPMEIMWSREKVTRRM